MTDNRTTMDRNGRRTDGAGPVESLRELVIQAGLELLDRHGLSLTFATISYARVFEYLATEYEVTVTRGSVHERIWASQDDFRRDVLAESVAYFPTSSVNQAILDHDVSTASPAEFARDLAARSLPEVVRSELTGRFQSVKALASWFDDPLATETLHRLLTERATAALYDGQYIFDTTLRRLGLRPTAEHGLTSLQSAGLCFGLIAALTEGGLLNYHAGSFDVTVPVEFTDPSLDDDDPWPVLSVGIKSLLDFFYEPDPEAVESDRPLRQPGVPKVLTVEPNRHLLQSRSSRRSRAQLRELVLSAAVELLLRDGAQLKPELLNYASVFAHIRDTRGISVHRSSVHPRIWANNDEYRYEVLARSVEASATPVPAISRAAVEGPAVLAPDGTIDRRRSAYSVFRNAQGGLAEASDRGASYRRFLQIKAALIDQEHSESRAALRAAIARVDQMRMAGNTDQFRRLILELGFRVKPETGLSDQQALETFEVLTMTIAAGLVLNEQAGIAVALQEVPLATGDEDGGFEGWSPWAIGMRAFFEQIYEEAPLD